MDLCRQRDRLALARVELPHYGAVLGTPNLHPSRSISCPILNRFRRKRMLQLSQYSSWNENSCVELFEKIDLADQDEVIDRRRIGYNDDRAQC
jgi:hypothetical protein